MEKHEKVKKSDHAVNFDSLEVIGGGQDDIKTKAHGKFLILFLIIIETYCLSFKAV